MKIFKKSSTKRNIESCLYPKCKKDVHSTHAKYCGEHQRKIENIKDFGAKGIKGVIGSLCLTLLLIVTKPIRSWFKI